jgi:UrcA family protein
MNKLTKTVGFLALGLPIVAPTAYSGDTITTRNAVVAYSDLNLNDPAGASSLYRRIQGMAVKLCAPEDPRDNVAALERRRCVRAAIGDAVTRLNRPLISDLHRNRTGSRIGAG